MLTQVLTIHAFVAQRRDPRRRRAMVALAGAGLALLLAWSHARVDEQVARMAGLGALVR